MLQLWRIGMIKNSPKWGEIYQVNLEPTIGSETGKSRPAVVVSNDTNNENAATVTIAPLTSKTSEKIYPFEVLLPKGQAGLSKNSRIKLNQIRTIDKQRLIKYIGKIDNEYIAKIKQALIIHLDLD